MCKKLNFLLLVIIVSPIFSCECLSDIFFTENFEGKDIDKTFWNIKSTEGQIEQNDKLFFRNDKLSSNWDKNYVISNKIFPAKTPDGKVLSFELEVNVSHNANYILGLMPTDANSFSSISKDINGQFSFHGNHLDRALWFLKNARFENIYHLVTDHSKEYDSYKVRLELGPEGGVLWQYDIGNGWKTGRDDRGTCDNKTPEYFKFYISSYFYAKGELFFDNLNIRYVKPSKKKKLHKPHWPAPMNSEFNGTLNNRFTNWAAKPGGVWTPFSKVDLKTSPGWAVLHGPEDGYGLMLRIDYPFLPEPLSPFYVETHFRYPTIDEPEGNYQISLGVMIDGQGKDGNLLYNGGCGPHTEYNHLGYIWFTVQNILSEKITKIRVNEHTGYHSNCDSGFSNLPEYWNNGSMYLQMGFLEDEIVFSYKFKEEMPWKLFYRYQPSDHKLPMPVPLGCDLFGPCEGADWKMGLPKPWCKADKVSFEIDYVRFSDTPSGYHEGKGTYISHLSAYRDDIVINGHPAFVIKPQKQDDLNKPWIWFFPSFIGQTLPKELSNKNNRDLLNISLNWYLPNSWHGAIFKPLLDNGFYICGIDVGDTFGNPESIKIFTKFYDYLVSNYKLEKQANLFCQSRGGTMAYNWASDNPDAVKCIAGIFPVADLASYPGLEKAAKAYNLDKEEFSRDIKKYNPIDRITVVAERNIPVFHLCGDNDGLVPMQDNTLELLRRYNSLGGRNFRVHTIKGGSHGEFPEYFNNRQLIQFLLTQGQISQNKDVKGFGLVGFNDFISVTKEGRVLLEDDKIIFSKGPSCNLWEKWGTHFVYTNKAMAKTEADKVLRFSAKLKSTEYALSMLGFYPDAAYTMFLDPDCSIRYGYHGNRATRTLMLMEGLAPTHYLRVDEADQPYLDYSIALELGSDNGALWQYDKGDGFKTIRDTRGNGTGDDADKYRFVFSTNFYDSGELIFEDIKFEYVKPSPFSFVEKPDWPKPLSAEFNGYKDDVWSNRVPHIRSGEGGIFPNVSRLDFDISSGWLVACGPKDGWGMYLVNYPFLPEIPYPFYVETKLRYPKINKPSANYVVSVIMRLDVDGDYYTNDTAMPQIVVQNLLKEQKTQVYIQESAGILENCKSTIINMPFYWNDSDLYLKIILLDEQRLRFEYRTCADNPWKRIHEYSSSQDNKTIGFPVGCDLLGPCEKSEWKELHVEPMCRADEVTFEVDYIRVGNSSSF